MDATATADLTDLSLPELQQRYAEVLGEETKCPNKRYLVRRITEAIEGKPDGAGEPEVETGAGEGKAEEAAKATDAYQKKTKLTKLDIDQLRARYLEIVGRPTRSNHRGYLVWKIRQAERGRVRIGPIERSSATGAPHKIIPLRMELEVVERLDTVRRQRGLRSRMDLFREALGCYLEKIGEADLARRIVAPGEPEDTPAE